jgi:hypothetical protein
MKIVQSYWSKPVHAGSDAPQNRTWGGWPKIDYFYYSWALSCLQFRKYYNEVALVTDSAGAEILAGALQLPYTSVSPALDAMQDTHTGLWALGKIHTCLAQETPFIHADGDVITWRKFDDSLEAAPLLAQNKDIGYDFYTESLEEIRTNSGYIPPVVSQYFKEDEQLIALNCGIMGGNDLAFIHRYCHAALEFVQRNETLLSKIKTGKFNAVYEQYLLSCMAREANIPVQFYYGDEAPEYERFVDYLNVPKRSAYFHPVGLYKKDYFFCTEIQRLLQLHYPDYYERVKQLLRKQNATVVAMPAAAASATQLFPLTLAVADKLQPGLAAQLLALCSDGKGFAQAAAPVVDALDNMLQPALEDVLQLEAAVAEQLQVRSKTENPAKKYADDYARAKLWLAETDEALMAASYQLNDDVRLVTVRREWVPECNLFVPLPLLDALLNTEPDECDIALKPLPGDDLPLMILPLTGFLSLMSEFVTPVSLQFIIDELLKNEELTAMDGAEQMIHTVAERVKWMLNEGLIVQC